MQGYKSHKQKYARGFLNAKSEYNKIGIV